MTQQLESENSPLNFFTLHKSLLLCGSSSLKWVQLEYKTVFLCLLIPLVSPFSKNDFTDSDLRVKFGLSQSNPAVFHIGIVRCFHVCLFMGNLKIPLLLCHRL